MLFNPNFMASYQLIFVSAVSITTHLDLKKLCEKQQSTENRVWKIQDVDNTQGWLCTVKL